MLKLEITILRFIVSHSVHIYISEIFMIQEQFWYCGEVKPGLMHTRRRILGNEY
jgi:hypothetical protein